MIASVATRGEDRRSPARCANSQRRPRVAGRNCSLESSLHDVGQRLQQPERADPVRAVAVLEAAEQLALDAAARSARSRRRRRRSTIDLTIMIQRRLVEADLGERQRSRPRRFATSTAGGARRATFARPVERLPLRSGTRVPGGTRSRSATGARTRSPFEPHARPRRRCATPRRSASAGEQLDALLAARGSAARGECVDLGPAQSVR